MRIVCLLLLASALAAADLPRASDAGPSEGEAAELRATLVRRLREKIDVDVLRKQIRDGLRSRVFEEELRELLERFRELVLSGDPDRGIPVLDPFESESYVVDVTLPPGTVRVKIDLEDVVVTGLGDFVVDVANFAVLGLRLDYAFALPEMVIEAENYELSGFVMDQMNLTGAGRARLTAVDTALVGHAKLGLRGNFLHVSEFEIAIEMEQFISEIEGLLDGEDQTVFLNQVLQQLVPGALVTQRRAISDYLGAVVVERADEFLKDLTLLDLIDLITGGNFFNLKFNPF